MPVATATAQSALPELRQNSFAAPIVQPGSASQPRPLPSELAQVKLGPARFDPFGSRRLDTRPFASVPAAVASVAVVRADAPAIAAAPQLTYSFFGRMLEPQGQLLVYLSDGDAAIAIARGTQLAQGWVVDSVDASTVRLAHPASGTKAEIPLPAEPDTSSR